MEKILGLDLGTNSIGWAIRDLSVTNGNQIIDKGVLTFEKGVAMNKDVEEPKVKKRTESRRKRRNYQAEKYRKAALLKCLIENNLCPLTIQELRHWSVGDWQVIDGKKKNTGRKYPQSEKFIQWLRFDFDGDGKPDFERLGFSKHENCYLFRMLAVSELPEHKKLFKENPMLLGRVFYQMVQRRGFRGRDEEEAKTMLEGSEKANTAGRNAIADKIEQYKTLGAALYQLNKEGIRIRKRYNLRTDFEAELQEICRVQNITEGIYNKLWHSIIWQRPLRSQKGLVGICTFEKNKRRCPISHPLYEEFRTWVFLNNLKIEIPDYSAEETLQFIQKNIYPLFSKKTDDFRLSDIAKVLDKINGRITANFKFGEKDANGKYKKDAPDTKVLSNKLMYHFNEILGTDWKEIYNWNEILNNLPKNTPYSFEDIWHVLFTFESKEELKKFASIKLKLNKDNAEKFSKISLPQGYATLSLSAIKKILPYLQKGFIYSDAIYLANLHKVLGQNITPQIISHFADHFPVIKDSNRKERIILSVVNGLIARLINSEHRYAIENNRFLDETEKNEIQDAFAETFGEKSWNGFSEKEKKEYLTSAESFYWEFLKKPMRTTKDKLFYKLPRLHDAVFEWLQLTYQVPDKNKKYLWHPSEQETYPNAKEYRRYSLNGKEFYIEIEKCASFEKKFPNAVWEGFALRLLGDPQPISRGFKNPMALKTLHKLKYLINYLLKVGKIDEDTRVVVEIARELNDANRRKAIDIWQRFREKENEEFAKAIISTVKPKYPDLDENDPSVINKFRLWFENIENSSEVLKQVKGLKNDVEKMRLWSEQRGQCIYTGKIISITDLFDGARFDFEHTIPASISFDNELKNLTIADTYYNRHIKGNKLPSECPNYEKDAEIDGILYTAIMPRIKWMEEKVKHLEKLYLEWQKKTSDKKEVKDSIIQKRHLIKFDLDYWRYKYKSFTCKEYKAGWRNSQLRDTQIITKYALPYLKTIFKKIEVQKGEVTATFREIYQISPRLEKKDRSKYSHHAIDAATLTLIPPAVIRDKILLHYNEEKERDIYSTYHEKPRSWSNYHSSYILSIEDDVLINNIPEHRTLTQTRKIIRKRGRIQYVKQKDKNGKWVYKLDHNGKRIPLIAQGDTIRGQLHLESTYGKIKKGDEYYIVERYPIAAFTSLKDCRHIVDERVRELVETTLSQRIKSGMSFEEAKIIPVPFPSGKSVIKNVRCKVAAGRGYLTPEKAMDLRKHEFLSPKDYKQFVYSQNSDNILCLYYEGKVNNKIERAFKIVGLLDLARLKLNKPEEIIHEPYYCQAEVGRGKNKVTIPLCYIIKNGVKCIFFKENIEELKELNQKDLLNRVFRVYKFNEVSVTKYLYLQNHNEARKNEILGDGETIFIPEKYQPRLKLSSSEFTAAIEGKHFKVMPNGKIEWIS